MLKEEGEMLEAGSLRLDYVLLNALSGTPDNYSRKVCVHGSCMRACVRACVYLNTYKHVMYGKER